MTDPTPKQTYIGCKIVFAWPEDGPPSPQPGAERGTQPGYAVVYEDGHCSWSPKDVFEEAYHAVPAEDAHGILTALEDRLEALRNGALLHEAIDEEGDRRLRSEIRTQAVNFALAQGRGVFEMPEKVLARADSFARFIETGAAPPAQAELQAAVGPITRAEIERRGFDQDEGADQTMLGVMAKLGFPSSEHPMGTDPTHALVRRDRSAFARYIYEVLPDELYRKREGQRSADAQSIADRILSLAEA